MKKYCFGIDVGGTSVKCGLFTAEGEVLDKWEIPTRTEENGSKILPDIAESIKAKMAEKEIQAEEVAGVGIGVPGPVDDDGVVNCAVNLHWGVFNIEQTLSDLTGLPVKAGNDANVAALGEQWKGGGVGYKNLIMVTLGTGVGGGIILNEKILAGSRGAAAEIGHAFVDPNMKEQCNCGNYGCLEQFASATGIARLAREAMASTEAPSIMRNAEKVTAKTVFDAVKEGDALAIQVAERFGDCLGSALAVFAAVVDPQVIVIGGGVSKAGPILLDYIKPSFVKHAFNPCKDTEFAMATLGNDAGIFGAAKMVL